MAAITFADIRAKRDAVMAHTGVDTCIVNDYSETDSTVAGVFSIKATQGGAGVTNATTRGIAHEGFKDYKYDDLVTAYGL